MTLAAHTRQDELRDFTPLRSDERHVRAELRQMFRDMRRYLPTHPRPEFIDELRSVRRQHSESVVRDRVWTGMWRVA